MPRNEHKKVLLQLSEAYGQVHEGVLGQIGSKIKSAFSKEPEPGPEPGPAPQKEVDPKIKAYRKYMWDVGEYRKDTAGYDHPPTASDYGLEHDEINDLARRAHAPEDAEHVFKNTEAGYEREDFKHKYSDRVKAVNLAMKALKQLNDNIKHEYPDPKDREERDKAILPLVRAHNQLSIALIELVGEKDRDWIMGGQADAVAQSQLDFKPADGREW